MLNRGIEPVGVDIYTPDFIGVAKALGCAAQSVEGEAQLRAALSSAGGQFYP
jgi:acetolactate synthase-1/2/3 large subunit